MLDFVENQCPKKLLNSYYIRAIMYFLRLFFDKFVYVPITKT